MNYTVCLTSCNRFDLLEQTLDMFRRTAEIPPDKIIICDDSDAEQPEFTKRADVQWMSNGKRRGQIFSCDRLMSEVRTEYVFWLECDWGFHEHGYLTQSLDILEKYPEVLQVWLRGIRPGGIHTVSQHPTLPLLTAKYHWPGWEGGFSFNPGLRRLSDYRRIGSYGRHVGYDPRGCGERKLGRIYHDLGYVAAILPKEYTYHIGDESHVDRTVAPDSPRILVAIPTADELDYTAFQKLQMDRYGRNWPGGISGLQKNGKNERCLAVAETWWRDLANQHNVDGKFFTGKELGCDDSFVSLPEKNRRICQYALDNGYDRLFRCDDDTWCDVALMVRLALEHEDKDYAGSDCGGFAIGGAGIWLSRRAMQIVADGTWDAGEWRDDAFIGAALKAHGIPMFDMPGCAGENQLFGEPTTLHPVSPQQMRQMYQPLEPNAYATNPAS